MGEYLWLVVTPDRYELPMAVADTAMELGRMLGLKGNMVSKLYCEHNKGMYRKWTQYKIIKLKVGKGKS